MAQDSWWPLVQDTTSGLSPQRFWSHDMMCVVETQMILMMLGSPSKVRDISVATSRWQVFSALHGVTRGSVVHTQS